MLHILIQTVGTLGYISTPIRYVDSTGHKTIGVGFNLDASGAKTACESVGIDFAAVYAGTKVKQSHMVITCYMGGWGGGATWEPRQTKDEV